VAKALIKHDASSALGAALTSTATLIALTTGTGVRFPPISGGDFYFCVLEDINGRTEVVKVVALSGDTMTVERAKDGTGATPGSVGWPYSIGDAIELRVTQSLLELMLQRDGDTLDCGTV
jgi:hypothetical protein